ncbi:hypothetical protein [Streptomyces sp. NPDC059003]|uniref:hypothetical protein n=1 Tax=Streptomyces sp. NPDC059003 TaxID=3346691 RepID=UPI0036D0FC05
MALTLRIKPGWDEVRNSEGPPVSYVEAGQWPRATLRPQAPAGAHLAQAIAASLEAVMVERDLSARAVARLVGATHPTITRLLDGDGLTDARSVFLLEVALQVPLWPRDLYKGVELDVAPKPGAS